MASPEGKAALAEEAGAGSVDVREEAPRRVEVVPEKRQTAEKPEASGEIVIEEISIDGMCGVY
jgi:mycofactocin precursor